MNKQVKQNFKKTGLQLLHWMNGHVLDPPNDYLLDRYVKSQTIGGRSFITLTTYEKGCCCLLLPYDPRTCLRSPILSKDCQVEFEISFNDEVKTKFFWMRDEADVLYDVPDRLCIAYDPESRTIEANGQVLFTDVDDDLTYRFVIKKQGNKVAVNEHEFEVQCKDEYWMSLGLMSAKGTDNSVNIHSLCIE